MLSTDNPALAGADRCRAIVRAASEMAKDPQAKSWLFCDERGQWEKTAAELLEKSAKKAAEMGLSAAQHDHEISRRLVYLALSARAAAVRAGHS